MNVKQLIVRVNDWIVYLLLTLVVITAALVAIGGQPIYGTVVLLIGFLIVSVLSGFWIAISTISENGQRTNVLLEKQSKLIEKLNRSLEAHSNNQFPSE